MADEDEVLQLSLEGKNDLWQNDPSASLSFFIEESQEPVQSFPPFLRMNPSVLSSSVLQNSQINSSPSLPGNLCCSRLHFLDDTPTGSSLHSKDSNQFDEASPFILRYQVDNEHTILTSPTSSASIQSKEALKSQKIHENSLSDSMLMNHIESNLLKDSESPYTWILTGVEMSQSSSSSSETKNSAILSKGHTVVELRFRA